MFKLTRFIFKKRYVLIFTIIAIICQCYLQLMLPEYMGKIQALVTQNIAQKDITVDILIQGAWMILISVGVLGCAACQFSGASYISSFVGKELRKEVYTKVNNLSLSDYNQFGTATLITRTTNDIEQIKNFFTQAIRVLVMSPTYMVIALIKTIRINAHLSIVIAIAIPLVIIIISILFAIASPLFRQIQIRIDDITVVLRENLTGIRVIRAYNQEKEQSRKFDKANKNMTRTIKKVSRTMSFAMPSVTIIFNLLFVGIYMVGYALAAENTLDPSGLTSFASLLGNTAEVAQYAMQVMFSFVMFAMVAISVPQATVCAKRINEVLNLKDETVLNEDSFDPSIIKEENKGIVEFKNVTFAYPDSNQPCIENVSFKTKPGTTTAIIGSTGSGKSTIINLIPRFYDATSGEVLVDGVNVKEIPQSVLRDKMGFVPQQAVLFYGSLRENLKFGKSDATDDEINEALRVSQAQHFVSKLPEGLDTFVSQSGKNFSGGQKQRLAIARALVRKPEIYVFDDSFSALDFKTDVKLRTALRPYTKDSSIIVVAQRVSSILDADNIIVVDDGKVVGQGTHKELLVSCPTYQDIVKSQLDPDEVEKTIKIASEFVMEGGDL